MKLALRPLGLSGSEGLTGMAGNLRMFCMNPQDSPVNECPARTLAPDLSLLEGCCQVSGSCELPGSLTGIP